MGHSNGAATPFAETEVLLALLNGHVEQAEGILGGMSLVELRAFSETVTHLRALLAAAQADEIERIRRQRAEGGELTSPYLPPGVAAVAIAPSDLLPSDLGYVPIERHAVVVREGAEPVPSTPDGGDRA